MVDALVVHAELRANFNLRTWSGENSDRKIHCYIWIFLCLWFHALMETLIKTFFVIV